MKDKYYTPELEEFYVGFEYESEEMSKCGSSTEMVKSFIKTPQDIIDAFNFNDWHSSIRVKYLDKEDIESLGFKDENILHPTVRIYSSEYKNQNGDNISLLYSEKSNWCLIFAGEFGLTVWRDKYNEFRTSGNIFAGYIKNISELKKILRKHLKI